MTSLPEVPTTSLTSLNVLTMSSAAPVVLPTSSVTPVVLSTTSSAASLDPTTTSVPPEPATTTTSTSTSTSTAPTSTLHPRATGFCLKHITPNRPQFGYHVRVVSPSNNIALEAPTSPTISLLDLDPNSGNLTVNSGAYAGYQVQAPLPYNSQTSRVLRIAQTPPATTTAPLYCVDPTGAYVSESVLRCTATGTWDSGARVAYTQFGASVSATASVPFQVLMEGYSGTTF